MRGGERSVGELAQQTGFTIANVSRPDVHKRLMLVATIPAVYAFVEAQRTLPSGNVSFSTLATIGRPVLLAGSSARRPAASCARCASPASSTT